MLKLTTNYSESLAKLLRAKDAPIDGIEVGPWMSPEKIKSLQEKFSDYPFQFHAGSFISRYRYWPGALNRLTEYHASTQSEWVSLHIELLHIGAFFLSSRFNFHLPPPSSQKAKNNFIQTLLKLKNDIEIPIILENLPSLHQEKYFFAANPLTIAEIVRETNSGFLLDISHARIASSYQKMSIKNYLEKLPLEKVVQIHVSGAREKDGRLQDAHESMQDEDYEILRWVLEKTTPKVVTLEYFRELKPLREQLWKLREIIDLNGAN